MPLDRGAIDSQLREIGEGERWWESREFRDLPYLLHNDERISGLARGHLLRRIRPRPFSSPWLLVATNNRIICLKQERFARQQVDIHLDQLVRLRHRSRFGRVRLTITTRDHRYRIRIAREDAFRFVGALSSLVPSNTEGRAVGMAAWLPGLTPNGAIDRLSGIFSNVALLPGPNLVAREDLAQVEATVERLESEMERLQQHVDFLERLLESRAPSFTLPSVLPADDTER